jgi:hypothetical protein
MLGALSHGIYKTALHLLRLNFRGETMLEVNIAYTPKKGERINVISIQTDFIGLGLGILRSATQIVKEATGQKSSNE